MADKDKQKNMKLDQTFNIQGIEIFAEGTWNGDTYTVGDLDEMVSAFSASGVEPPLKLGHNTAQEKDGQPAFGWVDKIYRQGGKLLADFRDIPKKLYEAMKRGNYKNVSSEIYWNFKNGETFFPRVLSAVALLGADIPAVTDLGAIEGLYEQAEGDIRIYDFERLGEAEETHQQEEIEMAETKEMQTIIENLKKENEALEATYAEAKKLKEDALAKLAEQQAEAMEAHTKEFIKNQKDAGRILPAFEAEVEALFDSATDKKAYTYTDDNKKKVELTQRELLERFVTCLPKMIEFKELGKDDGKDLTRDHDLAPDVEVDRQAKMFMDSNEKLTYEDAIDQVLEKDADLKKAYLGGY